MSLGAATFLDGTPLPLRGTGPFPGRELEKLAGIPFLLPCEDPWVRETNTLAHSYLDGARQQWQDDPEFMDVLDPDCPVFAVKRGARDLYLDAWSDWRQAGRLLDVGCGVGRMSMPFIDSGADVIGVDADLQSLCRYVWHAAGRPGRIDLHWTSMHRLPDIGDFDVVLACEVLCYAPDPSPVLAAIFERLRPGGVLLISVEARWGWAASVDALPGTAATAVGGEADDHTVHVPGERWVRTYGEARLREELDDAGFSVERIVPMLYTCDGPLEDVLPDRLEIAELRELEARCRRHPVWAPLNRVWSAVARRPPRS